MASDHHRSRQQAGLALLVLTLAITGCKGGGHDQSPAPLPPPVLPPATEVPIRISDDRIEADDPRAIRLLQNEMRFRAAARQVDVLGEHLR